MCPPCWSRVPQAARDFLWRHYRRGQERDKRVSAAYLAAARVAHALSLEAAGHTERAEGAARLAKMNASRAGNVDEVNRLLGERLSRVEVRRG